MLMGHEVTVVDNFFTGRKRNIEQWLGHENFELITHDIVTPLHLESQFFTVISCFIFVAISFIVRHGHCMKRNVADVLNF